MRIEGASAPAEEPAFFKSLVEHSIDIVTVVDELGRIVFKSPAFERFFGYGRAELVGEEVLGYIHEDERTEVQAAIGRVLARESEVETVVARFRHKDGGWRYIEAVGRLWQYGGADLLLVNSRDITDKQEILHQLRTSNNLLAKTIESSRNVVSITRVISGEFVEVNEEWLRVSGFRREEVIGRTANELGIWGSPENRDRMLEAIRQGGGRLRDFEATTHTPRGPRQLVLNVETLEIDGDSVILMTGSDVTESRVIEEQLRQAQKMEAVGQLTGGVAHDFNNLLAIIIGRAELLREAARERPDLDAMIEPILQASERGAKVTRQLLAFSRRQMLAPRSVHLGKVLARMEPLLKSTLTPALTLEIHCPDDVWVCEVDPGQLESATLNLLINARDAMQGQGRIRVDVENRKVAAPGQGGDVLKAGEYVVLSVTDDGSGMDETTLSRVFEPFFTTKPPGRGTGLGLSMVFGFARQSGGQVDIRSQPGSGTVVTLWFPRSSEVAGAAAEWRTAGVADPGRGETILVLEDEPDLLDVVTRMLRDMGYQVLPARDEATVRHWLLAGEAVDLMLSDIVIAGSRPGPAMVRELLELRPDLPVIYMSGYPTKEVGAEDLPGSREPILAKPFTRAQLAARVFEALNGRRSAPD
ncbi:MAG: PAS domain S-box protein [Gammaproteobacteria bacterium]|nr:PAS domain S-box protein [Gammaproteobacteria bacterium]